MADERGDPVYFEVFKGTPSTIIRMGYVSDFRYFLTMGYSISGTDFALQVLTSRGPKCSISDLVNAYIKSDSFGHGVQVGDRRLLPVRNMQKENKELGYEPLDLEEMAEFKLLLLARDPERYKLSFPS